MIGLVRLALRRPYTSAIAALLILLLGALSITRMIVDIFPVIDIPVVFVAWNYPGLNTEDMERRVVLISERAYSTTVNGIARIESQSIPGIGILKVSCPPARHASAGENITCSSTRAPPWSIGSTRSRSACSTTFR
jgi:multidrug efflux pump subunit AcrB